LVVGCEVLVVGYVVLVVGCVVLVADCGVQASYTLFSVRRRQVFDTDGSALT
jgi:hypothetical protein